MRNLYLLGAAVATTVAFAGAASAQVVADWALFGEPGDQVFTPAASSAANVSGLDMTRGAGLTPNVGNNSLNSRGWNTLDSSVDYVSFGFAVDAGWQVDLSELWMGSNASNTGPGDMGLTYSGDGFSSVLHQWIQPAGFFNQIIDLSSLSGLTGNVEFRIIALSDTRADGNPDLSIGAGGTFRVGEHFADGNFTNVQFTGSVIPTPGAVALFGLAGVAGLRRRRA